MGFLQALAAIMTCGSTCTMCGEDYEHGDGSDHSWPCRKCGSTDHGTCTHQ